jgi:hypothetical protein
MAKTPKTIAMEHAPTISLFVWLVADGWCWFVLREKYCWLIAGGWFILKEKYCWLIRQRNRTYDLLLDFLSLSFFLATGFGNYLKALFKLKKNRHESSAKKRV